MDDDFRDYLLEMADERLHVLLADSQMLRHLLPLGVSYREAVTAINAILEYRAQPPSAPPPPARKKRAPRKKKAAAVKPDPEPDPKLENPEPRPHAFRSEGVSKDGAEFSETDAFPEHVALPPLRPRRRDNLILLLPVLAAAALVVLLLARCTRLTF